MCLLDKTKGEKQPSKRTHTLCWGVYVFMQHRKGLVMWNLYAIDLRHLHFFRFMLWHEKCWAGWEIMALQVVMVRFHTYLFFLSFFRLVADFESLIGWCESVCVVKILPQKERWVYSVDELKAFKTYLKTRRIPLSTMWHGAKWYQTNLHWSLPNDTSLWFSK